MSWKQNQSHTVILEKIGITIKLMSETNEEITEAHRPH